ncbi:hypothetical protein A3D88_03215 [Candidatus Peribacteria bacterium RIFCSPHIGHO2_02_FULL_52_16]|nr:MAG: hypothetical protein A2706_04035 [Candidatus Peribacteria bacterium RIFCSPHIGHO2_01_FULL_51_35]OGJ61342.1 MAG: hypothetical protein A3D88_03215 [Candidatus Peribacteria bacterium RIFCSPHIGHO2_02_FULL_52_16]
MPSILSLIGASWTFYRKQPVLNWVLVWFLIMPQTLLNMLSRLMEGTRYPFLQALPDKKLTILLVLPGFLLLTLIIIWGVACVLVVCRRIIQSRAGRARTSFATLRKEAAPYILPLFFTSILRSCFTLFWAILLVVPGIIYSIRTTFYAVVVVAEDISYRAALHRSTTMVKGRTGQIFWILLGMNVLLFLPAIMVTAALEFSPFFTLTDWLIPLADIIESSFFGLAVILSLIASVELFAAIKKRNPIEVEL